GAAVRAGRTDPSPAAAGGPAPRSANAAASLAGGRRRGRRVPGAATGEGAGCDRVVPAPRDDPGGALRGHGPCDPLRAAATGAALGAGGVVGTLPGPDPAGILAVPWRRAGRTADPLLCRRRGPRSAAASRLRPRTDRPLASARRGRGGAAAAGPA